MTESKPFHVVFVLFDNVTQLDFTGPAQVLSRLPNAKLHVAANEVRPIKTDCGFDIMPTINFADCPQADLICVPGGFGTLEAMQDKPLVDFVKTQAANARYITSVCTGTFVLGAAGLLAGKRASTHWGYTQYLKAFGATHEKARVVKDGNLITAGGVSSGIDFALEIIAEIAGDKSAQAVQLAIEYNPAPPFNSGHPDVADPGTVEFLMDRAYGEAGKEMQKAIDAVVAG